ncbi:MAG: GAF domain-containing protein [Chloroflexi bacterium]|nr:GAF domain-containing protein [Chloroflexota bacterium]
MKNNELEKLRRRIAELEASEAKHAQTQRALQRRNRELALIHRASQAVNSALTLDRVLTALLEEVRHLMDVTACSAWLIDPETDDLVCQQATGPQNEIVRGWRLTSGEGIGGQTVSSDQNLIVPDTHIDKHYFSGVDQATGLALRSILSIPLRVKKDVIGVIQAVDTKINRFGSADLELLEPLAATAAIAIENARLYEKIRELWMFNENIVQGMEEGILLEDATGHITFVNPKGAQLLGALPQELVGQHWRTAVAPEHLPQVEGESAKRIRGVTSRYETVLLTKDEHRVPVIISARPLFDQDRFTGVLSVFTDITEHKQMEQYMLRTERLAAMGHVSAELAHEIKNPLQALSSYLELVLDFDLELDEREEYLHFCRQEVEHLTEITKRVLSFAQPAGDLLASTSLTSLVKRAFALVSHPLQLAHVRVTTDIPADLPTILVVPERIVQVLFNVMINASEAMPDGGDIHIAARADGKTITLTLTSNAPPIPPEHIERIFDPFFTAKPDGTGLSLFISHSIIEQHGGTISVKNQTDGQGVAFTIILPIARSIPAAEV